MEARKAGRQVGRKEGRKEERKTVPRNEESRKEVG